MKMPDGKSSIALDLHIHSKYSTDGTLNVKEIVTIARKRGLGGIAITDHNTIRGGTEAKQFETEDFKIIVGAEIATEMGEITGLFLDREVRSHLLREVVSEIKAQGGLVVVPHPFDRMRKSAFHLTEEYLPLVDAIEGFNSRCVFQKYNDRAVAFARQYHLPAVGGSDAHYANEIGLGGVIIQSDDIRSAILNDELYLFGKRSALLNHARTKFKKVFRKTAS